ncbi:hypothetical protein SK128_002119 [Halocaridina rubra]|uniref:BZIP domain-containing protein n=1 Tax=Halocaridina rubra TaxID=373956 RepID=A0AAN9A6X1_HALRR
MASSSVSGEETDVDSSVLRSNKHGELQPLDFSTKSKFSAVSSLQDDGRKADDSKKCAVEQYNSTSTGFPETQSIPTQDTNTPVSICGEARKVQDINLNRRGQLSQVPNSMGMIMPCISDLNIALSSLSRPNPNSLSNVSLKSSHSQEKDLSQTGTDNNELKISPLQTVTSPADLLGDDAAQNSDTKFEENCEMISKNLKKADINSPDSKTGEHLENDTSFSDLDYSDHSNFDTSCNSGKSLDEEYKNEMLNDGLTFHKQSLCQNMDSLKNEAYWERRRKNNEAAKRSRDARRAKEDEIAIRAAFLEQENIKLRVELSSLKSETTKLRCLLYNSS